MEGNSSGRVLRFVAGRYLGGELPLMDDADVVAGRDPTNELYIPDEGVSRVHAKFRTEGGQLEVRDLRSTNGTFVNGQRITRTVLAEGDRVLIGQSIMMVAHDPGWSR
jgi:pSer/pThr/pTyr-binding forkhead associated (FHA) protein